MSDLERVRAQEEAVRFQVFSEADAWALGQLMHEYAEADSLPVAIDIRLWDRQLLGFAMPGSARMNQTWINRKANVVRDFGKSSHHMDLQSQKTGNGPEVHGYDSSTHVFTGGSFPIHVKGTGVIGAATVSGLPSIQDHGLVVRAMCAHLDLNYQDLALEG